MHIISNTSPILNLAVIGRLSLLRRQFGEILIPQAVFEELRTGEDLPGSQAMRKAVRKDKGEAIALGTEDGTDTPGRTGRCRVAKSLKLKVTGLLGVVLRAYYDGEISSVSDIIEELREKAGFRIDAKLVADVLKE